MEKKKSKMNRKKKKKGKMKCHMFQLPKQFCINYTLVDGGSEWLSSQLRGSVELHS